MGGVASKRLCAERQKRFDVHWEIRASKLGVSPAGNCGELWRGNCVPGTMYPKKKAALIARGAAGGVLRRSVEYGRGKELFTRSWNVEHSRRGEGGLERLIRCWTSTPLGCFCHGWGRSFETISMVALGRLRSNFILSFIGVRPCTGPYARQSLRYRDSTSTSIFISAVAL